MVSNSSEFQMAIKKFRNKVSIGRSLNFRGRFASIVKENY